MNLSIIPKPNSITPKSGVFALNDETAIVAPKDIRSIADYFVSLFRPATGHPLKIRKRVDDTLENAIHLKIIDEDNSLGDEGYRLDISPDRIEICACREAGLFYGIQTLRQIFPVAIENDTPTIGVEWEIPCVSIEDQPRFKWRGLHLDVVRYMFSVETIKKLLDTMALYKLNIFHWHLTDDQGWRIEIQQYPKLTEIGSKRSATPLLTDKNKSDDTSYSGFYTQKEIREVVAYAQERFITVVPEIEMPGHAQSALASYPLFGCRQEGYQVWTEWGISEEVFCAGNEDTYTFLENVLTEVFDLFPGEFIHIGGDECLKARWQACPQCQESIQREGLADEDELQSYFIRRIEKFLNAHNRRLVGWDEILEGGLAPNATVMSWRGAKGGVEAANAGHDVVMTPNTHWYLNFHHEEDWDTEPVTLGRYTSLQKVYTFDPMKGIVADKQHHVLGGQGNIWTEYIATEERLEYLLHPRLSALSEAVWSLPERHDYGDYLRRLKRHLPRLDRLHIHYRNPLR